MSKRSFTVIHLKSKSKGKKTKKGGRYMSTSPSGAAKKAFNRECKSSKIRGQCTLFIVLRETTRGSKNKFYRYKMKRIKLSRPQKIVMGGTTVTIRYKTVAQKLKKTDPKKLIRIAKKKVSKSGKAMRGGTKMSVYDDDEGIYTGYYNIIVDNGILHTEFFLIPEEESEEEIVKNILRKHKKDFKALGVEEASIEIFDTMFYPSEEGPAAVKSALESQLVHIQRDMQKLNKSGVQERKQNAFDMSGLSAILDML